MEFLVVEHLRHQVATGEVVTALADADRGAQDVHTLDNHPERLPRWVELAREVVDEYC